MILAITQVPTIWRLIVTLSDPVVLGEVKCAMVKTPHTKPSSPLTRTLNYLYVKFPSEEF